MTTPSGPTKTKALCVATRCTTVDQFVATYHRFCDESSFFVATLNTRPIGLDTAFSIQLADNTPVLRGLCTILDSWTTPDNQWNRPGIRLGIRRLTPDSVDVFARLKTARVESSRAPRADSTPVPVRTLALITPAVPPRPPPSEGIVLAPTSSAAETSTLVLRPGTPPRGANRAATPPAGELELAPAPPPALGAPAPALGAPAPTLGTPAPTLGAPAPTLGTPAPTLGRPAPTLGTPAPLLGAPAPPPTPAPAFAAPPPTPARRAATPAPVVIRPRAHGLPLLPPGATPDLADAPATVTLPSPSLPVLAPTFPGEVAPTPRAKTPPPIARGSTPAPALGRTATPPPGSLPAVARTTPPPPPPAPELPALAPPPAIARTKTPPPGEAPAIPRTKTPPPGEAPAVARTKTPPPSEAPAVARTKTPPPVVARTKTPPPGIVPTRTTTPALGSVPVRVAPTAITKLTPAPLPTSMPAVESTSSKTPTLSLPIVTRPPAPPTPPVPLPVVPLGEAAPELIVDGPSSSPAPVAALEADTTRTVTPLPGVLAMPVVAVEPPRAASPRAEPRARTPDFNEMLAAPGAFAMTAEPDVDPAPGPRRAPRPETAAAVTLPVLDLAEAAPITPPDNVRHPTREITTQARPEPETFVDEPSIVVARDAFAPEATHTESRTPGSDFILPANPLANLSDDQLEGFIDCTIYEDVGSFDPNEASVDPGEATAALRPARTLTPLPIPIDVDPARPFRSSTGVPFALGPDGEPIPPQRGSSPAFAPPPEPAPLPDDPTRTMLPFVYPTHLGPGSVPPMAPSGPHVAPPLMASSGPHAAPPPPMGPTGGFPTAPPSGAYAPMPSPPPPAMYTPTPGPYPTGNLQAFPPVYRTSYPAPPAAGPRPRWWLIGGSVAVAAAVVAIVLGVTGSSSEPPAAPEPETGKPAPAAAAKPSAKPARTATREPERTTPDRTVRQPEIEDPTDDATEPPSAGGLPVVGSGACRLNITVTPAGSQVKVDGRVMGVSPLSIDTPCDKRRLDIAHVRYAPVTRWVTPALDKPETIEVALVRPTHSLTVVSVPPGATISIEGRRAGVTPTIVQLMGYYAVTLTIEKKGYKTATQRVYSKLPQDRITVRLLEALQ